MASGNFDIKSDCPEVYQGEFEKLLLAMRDMKNQMIVTLRSIEDAARYLQDLQTLQRHHRVLQRVLLSRQVQ